MNITIVNGTNRKGSNSIKVSQTLQNISQKFCDKANLVTLDNFTTLFTGEYLNLENATVEQKQDIENILNSKIIIFVIPTYHHGIPGSLKNFFDIIGINEIYDKKVIGFVATNLDVDAIRHARIIVNEIMAYNKSISIIPPQDVKIDLHNIDENRLKDYVEYLLVFAKAFNP